MKFANFLKNFAMDYVLSYLKKNKHSVIATANTKINLPILNEKQEAELMEAVYELIVDVIEGVGNEK